MKNLTAEAKKLIDEFGHIKVDRIFFIFPDPVTNDGGENITNPEAIRIENIMMNSGFGGGTIEGIYHSGDIDTLCFQIPKEDLI